MPFSFESLLFDEKHSAVRSVLYLSRRKKRYNNQFFPELIIHVWGTLTSCIFSVKHYFPHTDQNRILALGVKEVTERCHCPNSYP